VNTEVVLGVAGVAGTLLAALGGVTLQGRLERARWRREKRSELYISLVADAMQRQGHEEDWADTYPAADYPDGAPLRRRDWDLFGPKEWIIKTAELEVHDEPRMRAAWREYVACLDRMDWSGTVNGERDGAAEKDLAAGIQLVLAAGRGHGTG
jgi:hypothetical protein